MFGSPVALELGVLQPINSVSTMQGIEMNFIVFQTLLSVTTAMPAALLFPTCLDETLFFS